MAELRVLREPFVAAAPGGVAIRTSLRLTPEEERVLRLAGNHLGSLASRDLAERCRAGLEHDASKWAARSRRTPPRWRRSRGRR